MSLLPTSRGYAHALAAAVTEAITGQRQRLHWCVDLDASGLGVYEHPVDPPGHTTWGGYLKLFRDFLDAQPHWAGAKHLGQMDNRAKVALVVNHTLASQVNPVRVQSTWDIPWSANFTVLTGRPPPVGCWVVAPEPPRQPVDAAHPESVGFNCEGDQHPVGMDWYEAIPFALLGSVLVPTLMEGFRGVAASGWV